MSRGPPPPAAASQASRASQTFQAFQAPPLAGPASAEWPAEVGRIRRPAARPAEQEVARQDPRTLGPRARASIIGGRIDCPLVRSELRNTRVAPKRGHSGRRSICSLPIEAPEFVVGHSARPAARERRSIGAGQLQRHPKIKRKRKTSPLRGKLIQPTPSRRPAATKGTSGWRAGGAPNSVGTRPKRPPRAAKPSCPRQIWLHYHNFKAAKKRAHRSGKQTIGRSADRPKVELELEVERQVKGLRQVPAEGRRRRPFVRATRTLPVASAARSGKLVRYSL